MASSMAAIFCIAQVECDGEHRSHEEVPSCRHSANMTWELVRERAQVRGLTYDGKCLAAQEAAVETLGCNADPTVALEDILGVGRCAVYYGDVPQGGACEAISAVASDCEPGLACWEGRCVAPCDAHSGTRTVPYGFACPVGQRMTSNARCETPGGVGEPCASSGCVEGTYCREADGPGCEGDCAESSCIEQVAVGRPCDDDRACVREMCHENRCVQPPATGEACLVGRCSTDIACLDGTCGPPAPAICSLPTAGRF